MRAINRRDHHPAQRRWATSLEINQMKGSVAQRQCRWIFVFLLVPNIGAEDGLAYPKACAPRGATQETVLVRIL